MSNFEKELATCKKVVLAAGEVGGSDVMLKLLHAAFLLWHLCLVLLPPTHGEGYACVLSILACFRALGYRCVAIHLSEAVASRDLFSHMLHFYAPNRRVLRAFNLI